MDYDIVIVGAGVAGLTAAIYAGRSKYKILVIEDYMIGGQCVSIDSIENFPSYKNISGIEFTTKMYEQCVALGVKFVLNSIESIDVEKSVLHNLELETLRLALSKLSEEEMELINALYFCEEPVTERELAEMFNISQPAVHKRKMAVLSKLKNFF